MEFLEKYRGDNHQISDFYACSLPHFHRPYHAIHIFGAPFSTNVEILSFTTPAATSLPLLRKYKPVALSLFADSACISCHLSSSELFSDDTY